MWASDHISTSCPIQSARVTDLAYTGGEGGTGRKDFEPAILLKFKNE